MKKRERECRERCGERETTSEIKGGGLVGNLRGRESHKGGGRDSARKERETEENGDCITKNKGRH